VEEEAAGGQKNNPTLHPSSAVAGIDEVEEARELLYTGIDQNLKSMIRQVFPTRKDITDIV
jgi:hypothetical protein